MKKLITFLLFGWLVSFTAVGQVTFYVSPSTIAADQGQNIDIEVKTNNFTNVISFEFSMDWNTSVLQFNSISNTNSNLAGYTNTFPSFGPATITSSLITSWLDQTTVNPVTLPDGETLFTLNFTVVGTPGASSGINISNTEVSDNNFSIVPSQGTGATATTNGGTSGGPLTMTVGSVSDSTGKAICIPVSVDNFDLIEGFQHSLNYDASVLSFDSVGAINLADLASGNFGTTNASSGNLSVSWQDLTTGVGVSVPNGTEIYKLYFTIIGAGGTSSNVSISGTPIPIEVTQGGNNNAPLTTNNGTVTVLGNSGAINGVTFNASDVSGDNGAQVCVDVTVDNFDQLVSAQYGMEFDETILSFASIGFTNGNPLTLDPNANFGTTNTGTGLISFTWNDPTTNGVTLSANTSIYEVCFNIIGSAGQSSPVEFNSTASPIEIADVNSPPFVNFNEDNGSVTVTGTFDGLNLGYNCMDAGPGDNICVDVEVIGGFTDIVSVQHGFSWNSSVLAFDSISFQNGNPLTLNLTTNFGLTNTGTGEASFSWLDNTLTGINLTNNTTLYQVCFTVVGGLGTSSTLAFDGSNNTPIEASDGNATIINFLGTPCTVNVVENDPLVIEPNTTITDVLCFGNLTGAIDITVSGGTPDYTYSWSSGNSTQDLNAIGAGTYTVTVTDSNSETATATYTVSEPTSALSVTGTATGETAPGAGGTIDITPAGGTSGYTFAWSNTMTAQNLSNLAAGTYTVTVTDANNCTVTESFTVDAYVCPTITVTGTATGETAPNAGGAIDISVSGGTGSYTFAWSSGNSTEDLSNIPAGTYTVTATDGNNCTGTASFTVDAFGCPTITVTGTATDEQSVGAGGAIDVSVSGGTGSYTFDWSNSATTEDLNNIVAGTYTVTATDGNNCAGTASFTINAFVCPTITVSGSVSHETSATNDGAIDVSVSGGNGSYTYAWSSGNTTEDLSGLTGGTFTVTATDATGCTGTATFVVDGFTCPTMTIDFSASNVSCAGIADGSITATATGGTGTITYAWSPVGSGATISNLVAGTYTVTATDANDCTATNTVSITAPNAISISVTNTDDLTCQGANDGSITINVSGGTAPLSVDWGSGMTGTTISNLAAGTYTPTVTDGNNCQQVGGAITISEPTALSVTETITDATCNGGSDGSISLSISGGTGAYTVNWSNGATGTSVTGLPAGTISATISDANSCSVSEVFSVGQGQAITITQVVTNETVAGNDGAIDITVDPAGTYTYSWDNGATTQNISGLTAGNYNVIVTASNGCTASATIPVTNSLGIQSFDVTDVTCNGGNDGAISITTYGGEQPYSWSWSGPGGPYTTEDLSGLGAGTYTLTITDNTGLTSTSSYTIAQPTSISITPTVQHEINFCDGAIDLAVTGGTAPYSYVWNTGATSEDLLNICDGSYTATVTDANGCIMSSGTITVNAAAPTLPAGNISVQGVGCNGGDNGSITIEIIGGDPPFMLTLQTPLGPVSVTSTSHVYTFNGLVPGNHDLLVTDADNNTVSTGTIIIDEPESLSIVPVTIEHASALGVNDGNVYITPNGGTTPYSYIWNNGATSQDLIGVGPGDYEVTITDNNGCQVTGGIYTVGIEMSTNFDVTSVLCFGETNGAVDLQVNGGFGPYTYLWTGPNGFASTEEDISNIEAGVYTVMITDAMGNQTFSGNILVNGPTAPIVISPSLGLPMPGNPGSITADVTGGTPAYSYIWKDENGNDISTTDSATGLIGGDYFVTVTDNNGCTEVASFSLPEAILPVNLVDDEGTSCPEECDGVLEVEAFDGRAPYLYDWSNGSSSRRITGLCAGTYTVSVIDADGFANELSFEIIDPAPITVTIETSPGQAEAIVLGGTPNYMYQWDAEFTTDAVSDELRGGTHVLQITDSEGCQSEVFEFSVPYGTDCLRTRSVMSPNEDGKNDVFYVNCIEDYSEHSLSIFNRWGQMVYESDNYDNTWDGTNTKGEDLPEGGYFFILDYTDANGSKEQVKGAVTIIR